jgi:hypothetical protein
MRYLKVFFCFALLVGITLSLTQFFVTEGSPQPLPMSQHSPFKAYTVPRALLGERNLVKEAASYPYPLAIAAIFHNDAPYLQEWVEFHRLVGVSHFYLLNHMSSDPYQEILKPYIDAGVVELIDWPYPYERLSEWNQIQLAAYQHVLELAMGKAMWVAFIDTDEFLFAPEKENLLDVLASYKQFGGVGVNWVMFGTSNVTKIPDNQLLIEALYLRYPDQEPENLHIKSIVRPERVLTTAGNPHSFTYHSPYFQVTTSKRRFSGPFSPTFSKNILRINHYCVRDEEYFYQVKVPRWKQWRVARDPVKILNEGNRVEDRTIGRFIPQLKERLNMQLLTP